MPWSESPLESWREFVALAESAGLTRSPFSIQYLSRGIPNSKWTLRPSLLRSLGNLTDPAKATAIEANALWNFKQAAGLWIPDGLPRLDGDLFEWLALMQHHGAPTRLLDWSSSIYVAAYFAAESMWDQDGAIWVFNAGRLRDYTLRERQRMIDRGILEEAKWPNAREVDDAILADPSAPDLVLPTEIGVFRASRMVAQQGSFTVSLNVLTDHTEAILKAFPPSPMSVVLDCRKLIIPAAQKPVFVQQLAVMNVTAASLFPNIDGFGRSIQSQVRLQAALDGAVVA